MTRRRAETAEGEHCRILKWDPEVSGEKRRRVPRTVRSRGKGDKAPMSVSVSVSVSVYVYVYVYVSVSVYVRI